MNNVEIIIEQLPATFASKNSSMMVSRLEITATILGDIEDLLIEAVI